MRVPRIATATGLVIAASCAALLYTRAPAQAEFDNDKWVGKQLKCDGFDNNRCYRFMDQRRQGKPFLQTRKLGDDDFPRVYKPQPQRSSFSHLYYGGGRHDKHYYPGPYFQPHYKPLHDRDVDRVDYDRPPGRYEGRYEGRFEGRYDRREARYWDGGYEGRYEGKYADRFFERQCLHMVTVKGTEAQTETGALITAKRAWRANVRSDFGERYQDLDNAKHGEYRCWRSSTNESVLGRASEWVTGQYRKRCQVWAVPCLGERQKLEGDKDDRE
jgi:hypothetical protein